MDLAQENAQRVAALPHCYFALQFVGLSGQGHSSHNYIV